MLYSSPNLLIAVTASILWNKPSWISSCFFQAVQFVNKKLLERNPEEKELFDVIVLSNNSPQSGTRIVNSVKEHGRLFLLVFKISWSPTPTSASIQGDLG